MFLGCEYFRYKYECPNQDNQDDMISDNSGDQQKGTIDSAFEAMRY